MRLKAAILAAITVIALFAAYAIASFAMAYPEDPSRWILVVAIIALLTIAYVVIFRVRGER